MRKLNVPALAAFQATPLPTGGDEVSVLNYALVLEHLENAMYRDGLANFSGESLEAVGFQAAVYDFLLKAGEDEATHVVTLTEVITSLGGEPVAEGTYDFGDAFTDITAYLATIGAIENTGVAAYTGAAQFLVNTPDLLTAALTIHGNEARHASYLNLLNGESPFPNAFEPALNPDEVLAIAGPFVVDAEIVTPTAFEPTMGMDAATPSA